MESLNKEDSAQLDIFYHQVNFPVTGMDYI